MKHTQFCSTFPHKIMSNELRRCVICAKPNSNYKCPRCRQPYCSADCNKKHKEATIDTNKRGEEEGLRSLSSAPPFACVAVPSEREEEERNENSKEEESIPSSSTLEKPKRRFETDYEDIHRHRLRREHFERLALNLPLLEKLRSERLLETLRQIDNSSEDGKGEGEGGESALENALKNSDFRQFAEDVLDTITSKEEED